MWTLGGGDSVWVACEDESCQDEQLVLFPDSEAPKRTPKSEAEGAAMEPGEGRGVVPLEGGATDDDREECEPPAGWLSSIWEGGVLDG